MHVIVMIAELVRNREKLRTDFKATIKKIVYQFVKSVIWLVAITSFPAVGMCHLRHYTGYGFFTIMSLFIVA
jgi:hypothetical protein